MPICVHMTRKNIPINLGDVFRKNERFESVWVVKDYLHLFNHPPHVHIIPIDDPGRPLAYATAALDDPNLFVRLDQQQTHLVHDRCRVARRRSVY